MKEYFSNQVAKVYFHDDHEAMYLEYLQKVPNHDAFLEINKAFLSAFKENDTPYFIVDARKMGMIKVESQRWAVEYLIPEMIKHLGGKKLFHVQLIDQKDVMNRVSASNIRIGASQVKENLEIIQVGSEEEVEQYLKEVAAASE